MHFPSSHPSISSIFLRVADKAIILIEGLIIFARVMADSSVGPLLYSPIMWNSSIINVSTSRRVSHEKRVNASNDSKTITDKSELDGCLPTLIPCSSNALNSWTFSFCIDKSGAA